MVPQAREGILHDVLDEPGPHGVEQDIRDGDPEMVALPDERGLEASLEDIALSAVEPAVLRPQVDPRHFMASESFPEAFWSTRWKWSSRTP